MLLFAAAFAAGFAAAYPPGQKNFLFNSQRGPDRNGSLINFPEPRNRKCSLLSLSLSFSLSVLSPLTTLRQVPYKTSAHAASFPTRDEVGAPAHSSDCDYFPHIPGGGLCPYANRRPTSFWSSAVFLSTLGGGAAFWCRRA